MKVIACVVGFILLVALLMSLCFGLEWLGLEYQGFFAKKRENIRREVFEETKSYNEGKMQQLAKYRMEYIREKDPDAKRAIAGTVRTMFADYDPARIKNADLRSFLRQMQNQQ